ncbi:MAG: 6-phosphofructokinase, partial [Bacillota bacterium]
TIDNDIYGTDVTFGFHTAVDVATEAIDRVRTTAASHGRTILVEVMGNKAGWLTLYAGIAAGAEVILLPEIPFNIDKICEAVRKNYEDGKPCNIIAVGEGAVLDSEARFKKKERVFVRTERGETTVTQHLAEVIGERTGIETRGTVLGYIQRGGNPSPYDRVLSSRLGSYAGKLAAQGQFGVTVAVAGRDITFNALPDVAGKYKFVDPASDIVRQAEDIGVCFGR